MFTAFEAIVKEKRTFASLDTPRTYVQRPWFVCNDTVLVIALADVVGRHTRLKMTACQLEVQ